LTTHELVWGWDPQGNTSAAAQGNVVIESTALKSDRQLFYFFSIKEVVGMRGVQVV
jgi:hypothetical protein